MGVERKRQDFETEMKDMAGYLQAQIRSLQEKRQEYQHRLMNIERELKATEVMLNGLDDGISILEGTQSKHEDEFDKNVTVT